MNDHHREQKSHIISTAFREWGKTHFTTMSLMQVARKLSITKPALYRYFKSKDELLHTMVTVFIEEVQAGIKAFLAAPPPPSLEGAVRAYYGFLFDFFIARPYYLAFLLFYILRKPDVVPRGLFSLGEPLQDFFLSRIDPGTRFPDAFARATLVRFIQMHGVFWVMQAFRRNGDGDVAGEQRLLDFRKRISQETADKIRDQAVTYCIRGYCGRTWLDPAAFAAIAAASWITPEDLLEPDRIFSAVEAVIGEAGLDGASLERIAERIGLSKSSLYFYFKNKNEMLVETIRRERDHFFVLLVRRIEAQADFAGKLFAFCAAILSYMKSNPALMSVLHWMQYQNVGLTPTKHNIAPFIEKFEFIRKALQSGDLEFQGEEAVLVLVFIFFFLMNEMRFLPPTAAGPQEHTPHLSRIFILFCRGLGAVQTNNGDTIPIRSASCQ
jgi:AcrR family transcriptional regulator